MLGHGARRGFVGECRVNNNPDPRRRVLTARAAAFDRGETAGRAALVWRASAWTYYDYRTKETRSTNSIESFWKLFKYSVRSTHIHISREKMPLYLGEFCYRSNHREMGNLMFDALLARL